MKSFIDYIPEDLQIYIEERFLHCEQDKEAFKISIMGDAAAQSFENMCKDEYIEEYYDPFQEKFEEDFQIIWDQDDLSYDLSDDL